jgi:integrase
LRNIGKNADLMNPAAVQEHIANSKVCGMTKQKLALAYSWFCKTNGLEWKAPYFKWERKIPIIPTTENINKIISGSSKKYAALFTILAETGLEGQELSTMTRKDIDLERGIIAAQGCKGHNSRSFKLKPPTAELLRTYIAIYTSEKPFPNARALGDAWREARKQVAEKLNQPELKNIPMRHLRHHFATMKYDQTRDILLVKQLLGHKKLETTMFYTQLITISGEEEYTCKTATNVKEAAELIEHGFQYVTEMDGLKLFKKRK